jgi:SAM-dependent methyltransferase
MSFGAIADDYDRLRPGPPEAAVDWLLPEHCEVAIDLGAGTGLLTRVLAGKVARVIAVEPDERMRSVLLARSPGVRVLEGSGEAIPVADGSADGVFVSSAWHWMDPGLAAGEIHRVLRDRGRFGVIWTGRDHGSGWWRDVSWPERGRARGPAAADPGARAAAQSRAARYEVTLPEPGLFGNVMTESFRFTRAMTIDSIVDMLATYSGVITASPQDAAAALARARAALEHRFPGGGEIDVPMRARCWRADRTDQAAGAD